MREKRTPLIQALVLISVATLLAAGVAAPADVPPLPDQAVNREPREAIAPPFDAALKYPFTKSASQTNGHWKPRSLDYPYFGAPRGSNGRRHGGVDLYPVTGAGTPIKAIKDGTVILSAPFYIRRNGEVTYALLVDHGDYVAHYAELIKPDLEAGAFVKKEQGIGFLSGTEQLHFGLYRPGTTAWQFWHGKQPPSLIDPTQMMLRVFRSGRTSLPGASGRLARR